MALKNAVQDTELYRYVRGIQRENVDVSLCCAGPAILSVTRYGERANTASFRTLVFDTVSTISLMDCINRK